ncbi:NUDIX domain-containing protein [Paenibacillus macerans]|uniref:NUDIX hydrolase n=1 Tax=Paenibacillus macerans TaxID=44252 RepID=UPI0020401EA1|nr:NUDIX domain-containing protein [Paenibacillus macerans]MCM3699360.1 NUDIX domain-containing protein [Paenibacillus macerans]
MNETEYFDVFTPDGIKIGKEARSVVHAKGLWHQTFHCWIWKQSPEGPYLLFQLRHKNKDVFPSLLDISCAGHLQAGEDVPDGVRELEEELGIAVAIDELTYLREVAQEHIVPPQIIDREFNHVFIYECGRDLQDYRIQTEEISGLFWVRLSDFQQLLCGNTESLSSDGILVDEVNGATISLTKTWSIGDFTPATPEYYELLFTKMKELAKET